MKNKNEQRSGQTIIEAVASMGIVTVGLLGILSLLTQSLALNRRTSNELAGTYLAEEGIELAKNLIDHDVAVGVAALPTATNNWGDCLSTAGQLAQGYAMDYLTTDCHIGAAPGMLRAYNANTPLDYDPATQMYGYETGSPSIFTRQVIMKQNGAEITVISNVTWANGTISEKVNLEDHFYNWQDNY